MGSYNIFCVFHFQCMYMYVYGLYVYVYVIAFKDTTLCTGMLSKSMGQIIRVSAALHILFNFDNNEPLSDTISDLAIEAAIDFVEVCCQHTAYITGRGNLHQELDRLETGNKHFDQRRICTFTNYA